MGRLTLALSLFNQDRIAQLADLHKAEEIMSESTEIVPTQTPSSPKLDAVAVLAPELNAKPASVLSGCWVLPVPVYGHPPIVVLVDADEYDERTLVLGEPLHDYWAEAETGHQFQEPIRVWSSPASEQPKNSDARRELLNAAWEAGQLTDDEKRLLARAEGGHDVATHGEDGTGFRLLDADFPGLIEVEGDSLFGTLCVTATPRGVELTKRWGVSLQADVEMGETARLRKELQLSKLALEQKLEELRSTELALAETSAKLQELKTENAELQATAESFAEEVMALTAAEAKPVSRLRGRETASVRAVVSLDVYLNGDRWGEDCTVGQIRRQGRESAMAAVRGLKLPNGFFVTDIKVQPVIFGPLQ